jgi:hypothetical protein
VEDISTLFYLPLSAQAFEELNQLQGMMSNSSLVDHNDEWTYLGWELQGF